MAIGFVFSSLPDVGGHQANFLLASLAIPTFIAWRKKCARAAFGRWLLAVSHWHLAKPTNKIFEIFESHPLRMAFLFSNYFQP
ncbi:MAG TPA: hypothetical protein VHA06_08370 [Candidatus Angelobacter sp.]|nr:hypothetical protein [Candidatus Angelobacter sp.]